MPTKFPGNSEAAQIGSKRKDFYTVAELAIRWNLSERHIRRQIASGELIVHRFGKVVRVSAANAALFEARGARDL